MSKLTIGQMSEINGVTRQALRLYDEIGLLKPSIIGENGYRYYDISQCARLDMIQHMKSLGMELRTIKEQLDKKDLSLLRNILEQKKDAVEEQIRQLKYQKRAIERTITSYDLYMSAPPDGTIILEYIGKRLMYQLDSGINFYNYDINVYEEILRRLKNDLLIHHLPQIYFSNVGTILRKIQLETREFIATEFFVFIDQDYVPAEFHTSLPSGMYLCIYCNRFEKEKEYTLRLLDEINKLNYTIAGDCICEVIMDSTVFDESRRNMFYRIQVPISF